MQFRRGDYMQKDIDLIEGVQRRASKLVVWTKGVSYEERLKFLDITTLETRRVRGDLIEVFKIMKGLEDVNKDKFFTMHTGCTRGHELKLFKPSCHPDCRNYAFSNRIINMWNGLPSNIIACNTVYGFKHKIDVYLYGICSRKLRRFGIEIAVEPILICLLS
jgi:ribonuclease P/MRP protein subunit RPP40